MAYATINGNLNHNSSNLNGYSNGYAYPQQKNTQVQLSIKIVENQLEKVISVDFNAKVWEIKQYIIQSFCGELEQSYNFGLYLPPQEKRLGKFMSEDRCIREYRLSGLPPVVIFKYYSKSEGLTRDSKRSTKSKDSQQRFLEYVTEANADKCLKFLEKGVDPNYIHRGSGHTPLTKAAIGKDARAMILLLCRYGAFLEFRDRNGYTALHHASISGSHEAIQVLLDAGASVNARDLKGLSPLYNAICDGNSTYTCEILLKEKCDINVTDSTGQWTELHQACKRGKTDVVELVLLYGADINARTSAGNTALHMCASFNKVHCARHLLHRGIDKALRNKAGQTAHDVAALTANLVLMDDIANFKPSETEPFTTSPTFTKRKKQPITPTKGTTSNPLARENSTLSRDSGVAHARDGSISSNESRTRGASLDRSRQGSGHKRSNTIGTAPVTKPSAHPRTGSTTSATSGASSAHSGASTTSVKSALPPEFPTASNNALQMTLEELLGTARVCTVPKTKRGYGFHLKGLSEKKKEFSPSVEAPCSQFMFGVDKDSEAHKAGVLSNDFIYKVNGKDVSVASHKEVVDMIKKSSDPLTLILIQLTNPVPAPAPQNAAAMPPPAVPRRDPGTKVKGPRPSMCRSHTVGGMTRPADNGEQIYANMQHMKQSVAKPVPQCGPPPPPPAPPAPPAPTPPRTLERMNSAPTGVGRVEGYSRSSTLPVNRRTSRDEKREEVVMIPVLPSNTAAEIAAQRRRLTSVSTSDNHSMISTQSEPPKPLFMTRSPDNRPEFAAPPLPKSKSAEDIARKAAEMRKKRSSVVPNEKIFNYDLPPPPSVLPPPPPPDDLPPPPPITSSPIPLAASSPPPRLVVASSPPPPMADLRSAVSPPQPMAEPDKEDNESFDSGFIQNGKHVDGWEASDVADWLCGLGLGEYKEIFIENDIKGPNLLDLTKNDLKELGVTKLGHRITMMKEINTRLTST